GCGGEYTSSSGMIRHPLSGGNYQNNENCIWIIRGSEPINITFVSFDIESGYDYLYVRDGTSSGSNSLGRFSGDGEPDAVQITTNAAYLLFTSDGSVTRTGFEITWAPSAVSITDPPTTQPPTTQPPTTQLPTNQSTTTQPQGCGGEYTSSNGMIRHPLSGGNYQNNEICIWIIRASEPINITFVSFNTESGFDHFYVRDGANSGSNLLGRFSGDGEPDAIQTTTNAAYMLFTSDRSINKSGFEITWEPYVR
ncbi:unnamed protein product, partial [Meganyctiphanes norvegica]